VQYILCRVLSGYLCDVTASVDLGVAIIRRYLGLFYRWHEWDNYFTFILIE